MVSSNLPSPSEPTLDAILAPHHAINPPSNITKLLTNEERRAAFIASNSPDYKPPPPPLPFAPFRPDAPALQSILDDLTNPSLSLAFVASKNNTSLGALTLWMSRPDVEPILDQMERACFRHARLSAANSLTDAVHALGLILDCNAQSESQIPIPRDDTSILVRERSRTNTCKAAWLLYRISRSHPSIPMDDATRIRLEELRIIRGDQRHTLHTKPNTPRFNLSEGASSARAKDSRGPHPALASTYKSPFRPAPSDTPPATEPSTRVPSPPSESTERRVPSVPSEPVKGEEELMPAVRPSASADRTPTEIEPNHTSLVSGPTPDPHVSPHADPHPPPNSS